MSTITNKQFLLGVAVAVLVLKFGDRLPVVGPYVSKLK